jgi:hypothetical protein
MVMILVESVQASRARRWLAVGGGLLASPAAAVRLGGDLAGGPLELLLERPDHLYLGQPLIGDAAALDQPSVVCRWGANRCDGCDW